MILEKTIAVLPFKNRSNNEEEDYFGDGLAEELVNSLIHISGIRVISHNSSMRYKQAELSPVEIAQHLDAHSLIEGSFKKTGSTASVQCKLYDVESRSVIWTGRFTGNIVDLNAPKSELITQVVEAIRDNYGHFDFESLFLKQKTNSEEAYEYYLKGKYFRNRWTKEDYEQAISNFEKAIQIDPNLAQAYFELQHCYGFLWTKGWITRSLAFERIKFVTVKGMSLGPMLPEAFLSMAQIDLWSKWDFKPAIEKLLEGVQQYPAFVELQNTLLAAYTIIGDRAKAVHHSDICITLDPNNHFHYYNKGRIHFFEGSYAKAIELIERSIEIQPNFKMGIFDLFEVYLAMGDAVKFDDFVEKYSTYEHMSIMKYIYNLKYASSEVKEEFDDIGAAGVDGESVFLSAYKVLYQGNHQLAIDLIKHGINAQLSQFAFIKDNPNFEILKTYDEYNELLDRVFKVDYELKKEKEKPAETVKVSNQSKRALNNEEIERFSSLLEHHYEEEACYLNATLSLNEVAKEIGIHPNKLSWLVNDKYKMNFNEFTNHYRLKKFKSIAVKHSNQHLTILALAYESGFSSKTSFNSFFKKTENCSPRQWLKDQIME